MHIMLYAFHIWCSRGQRAKFWAIQISYGSVNTEDDKNLFCFYGEQIHIWSFCCSLPTICKHIHKSFPFHFLHLYHTPISLVIKAYSQVIPVCPASLSLLLPFSLTGERFFLSVNWLNSLSLLIYWTCELIISPVPQLSSSSLSQLHPSTSGFFTSHTQSESFILIGCLAFKSVSWMFFTC